MKRELEATGFSENSQRGSHVKFIKQTDAGIRIVIVPRHREVAAGTLRSILRQVSMIWDEFDEL